MAGMDYYGFNYASWWQGTFASADSTTAIKQMAGTGANTISISPTQFIGSRTSSTISPNQQTETDANLLKAMSDARGAGMKVVFKPHIDVADWSASRVDIAASDPAAFFASYKNFIVHYAKLAQQGGAEVFSIGTELSKMTVPAYTTQWNQIIDAVRQVYTGKLTYAANYGEEKQVQFWGKLDYIGTDLYAPLTNVNNPTVDQLVQAWVGPPLNDWSRQVYGGKPIMDYYKDLSAAWGKPVFITEIGFRSLDGANAKPWAFGSGGTVDQQEQSDLFTAFFKALDMKNTGWVKGVSIWDWRPVDMTKPNTLDPTDYTPQGKPALAIIDRWFDTASGTLVPPTDTPVQPPAPPPAPSSVLTANFVMQNDWGQGYWGDVLIRNDGGAAQSGWTLTLALPGTSKIEQVWGLKVVAQSGQTVTLAASESWTSTVAPGSSVKAGFVIGSASGASRQLDFDEHAAGAATSPPPPASPPPPPATTPPVTGDAGTPPVFKAVTSWVTGGPTGSWILGTDGNDTLKGTAGNDYIDGRKGQDAMTGGMGDDRYVIGQGEGDKVVELAGQGIDTVELQTSSYTMGANIENAVVKSWQSTTIVGNELDNVLVGERGDDVFTGGKGADLMTGGAGRDTFIYRDLTEGGDVIRDFQVGVDRLDLRPLTQSMTGEALVFDHLTNGLAVSIAAAGKVTPLVLLEGVAVDHLTPGLDLLIA